jgi:D-alanyl-D-alanine carboxypeptidase
VAALTAAVGASATVFSPVALAEKYAALVMDADTGEILHQRNADDARYPASLTKVMTLYLLFDAINAGEVSLTDKMTVSRNASKQPPSNLKLAAGSKIKVEDAILALVTKSANDVAVVVAEHLAGTERAFAVQMTEKARDLGLENTTFKNASGLPNTAQVTTAYDLALLADALLEQHAQYYHYFENKKFNWGRMVYKNHNELIDEVDGVDGIKTGFIRASGFNLVASAKRDGRRLIGVVMGGQSPGGRDTQMARMFDQGFSVSRSETAVASAAPCAKRGQRMKIRFRRSRQNLAQKKSSLGASKISNGALKAALPVALPALRGSTAGVAKRCGWIFRTSF